MFTLLGCFWQAASSRPLHCNSVLFHLEINILLACIFDLFAYLKEIYCELAVQLQGMMWLAFQLIHIIVLFMVIVLLTILINCTALHLLTQSLWATKATICTLTERAGRFTRSPSSDDLTFAGSFTFIFLGVQLSNQKGHIGNINSHLMLTY